MEKFRIMVVEDEGIIAADMRGRLEDMGYDASLYASSAKEAMKIAASKKPDLVLMDIKLDGEEKGIVAADKIRRALKIPVIYVTAYSDGPILQRAKITGPFGYLVKPVEESALRISIEMALYKHKMEMEREKLIKDLKAALARIKTLSGLLPICAWCKKIRDDKGYWEEVEAYVAKHSDAQFTHGICPECIKKCEAETKTSQE